METRIGTVYVVLRQSCDGARLGKVWSMDGYSSRASAERAVEDSTERHNAKERERAEEERHRRFPWQPRLYKPDTVDGKSGWVDWSGGIIIRVEELAVRE